MLFSTKLNIFERYLETYSFEEILELNEMTEAEALQQLVENGVIQLPSIKPVDIHD